MYQTIMEETNRTVGGVTTLCTAVIIQAVTDYQDLNKRGVVSQKGKSGNYSKNEIARFFGSDWCDYLLGSIGVNFTGEYILSYLQAQKSQN